MLRVDDRGVGGSTGNVAKSTSEDFAGDVLAGVTFLKSRCDIDAKKIGLIGHSEGGLKIAALVAALVAAMLHACHRHDGGHRVARRRDHVPSRPSDR